MEKIVHECVYALVLAAGFSSRAQAFKMALPLAGRAVLHRVLDALAPVVDGVWIVTGHEAQRVETLARDWLDAHREGPSVHTIHNPLYNEGMMSSVLAGACAVPQGGFLFILPGDYPLLTPSVFQALRAAALSARENEERDTMLSLRSKSAPSLARNTPQPVCPGRSAGVGPCCDVFIPRYNGKNGHPVLISPDCLAKLRALVEEQPAGGDATLKTFLSAWRTAYIDVADEGVLVDLDTPEDYARIADGLRMPRGGTRDTTP